MSQERGRACAALDRGRARPRAEERRELSALFQSHHIQLGSDLRYLPQLWSHSHRHLLLMLGSADTAVAEKSQVPIAASTTGKLGRWTPVEVSGGFVTMEGGFSKHPAVARGIQYQMGNTTHLFVELDKNAPWFLQGVVGLKARKKK